MRRALMLALLASGCSDTGQERVEVPLFVAGTDLPDAFVASGDVPVTVDRADLAFGPLYLCAGATAGDLCETARLEWLDTVVIDTLSGESVSAGELSGVTGPVRSWMYDLGISSQLTRTEPYVLQAAAALDGASLVVAGRAFVDGTELPFRASIPVRQVDETELGVPVLRKSSSDFFSHDVQEDEAGLLVRFDPAPWIASVDFRALLAQAVCEGAEPPLTCAEYEINPESEAYRALRNALTAGARPEFEWGFHP